MGEGRQRLRPWLERILNEGKITGVEWLDDSRTKFRIPWKHGGKHDWNPEDGQIFKEWALHTGKFREGMDGEDYALWKTRLRCAFNKAPEIAEMKEESRMGMAGVRPYRVYRLEPKKEARRKTSTSPSSGMSSQTSPPPPVSETAQVPMEPSPVIPSVVEECRSSESMKLGSLLNIDSEDLLHVSGAEYQLDSNVSMPSLDSFNAVKYETGTVLPAVSDPVTQKPLGLVHPNLHDPSFPTSSAAADAAAAAAAAAAAYLYNESPPAIEVTLLYSNVPYITYQVPLNPGFFRLCYISSIGEIQERDLKPDDRKELYGSDQAIKIKFEKGCCADIEGAANTANHILDNFSRGVEVTNRDGSIYVKRFCKVGIFHLSEIETHGKPVKISREEEVKIFDYQSFESKVRNYSKCRTDMAPEPKVFLQIGQSVPLDEMNEKILLCASVVSTKAIECLDRGKKERANTSEMSIDLSVSDEFDHYERCIKNEVNVFTDLMNQPSLQIDGEDELSVGLCVDINTAVENLSLDDPDRTPKATDDPFSPLSETKSEDEENSDPIH